MITPGTQPPITTSQAKVCTPRYTRAVSFRRHLVSSVVGLLACAVSAIAASQPAPAPPVPAPTAASPPSSPPLSPGSAAPAPAARSPIAAATDGVVSLERRGRPIGLGFVLTGDGRIVTSLSVIGDGNQIDARYADGSVVDVKVGHSDRVWNLALLVPQVGRWETGLRASTADPLAEGSRVRTFAKRGRSVAVASVVLKGRTEMLGGDGEILRDAIEVTTHIPSTDLGAPLVDEEGRVLGVVSNACKPVEGKPDAPCRTVAYGAPMGALRQFLRNAPSHATPPSPWLGIQGVGINAPIGGVRVVHIHPGSPAAAIELQDGQNGKGSDIIVAVDGAPVHSAEMLAEQVRSKTVGDQIQLIVLRAGKFHVLQTALSAAPSTRPSSTKTAR